MKHWLVDVNGNIADEYAFYRGMILTDYNYSDEDQIYGTGNYTFVRFFPELCKLDKSLDKTSEGGFAVYKARLNLLQ